MNAALLRILPLEEASHLMGVRLCHNTSPLNPISGTHAQLAMA